MTAIKWDDAALKQDVRDKAIKRLSRAAEEVRGICIRSMGSGSSGHREYKRTQKKKSHWSSLPGQPPHVDTGRLRSSITWAISEGVKQGNDVKGKAQEGDQVEQPGKENDQIIAVVGTNVKYAKALEFGYSPRGLAARPYLRPALEKAIAKIKWLFAS